MKTIRFEIIAFVLAILLSPLVSFAQNTSDGFSRQGIFGCSRNAAALSGSVGSFSATGGVYVPVADYTVELNTGTLVYQQCVLRGIVDRESESLGATMVAKTLQTLNTGNNGNPLYPVNKRQDKLDEFDRVMLVYIKAIQGGAGGQYVQKMTPQLANSYVLDRGPLAQQACPYSVDIASCKNGSDTSAECRKALGDARCADSDYQYLNALNFLYDQGAQALQDQEDCLNWGKGFYCITTIDQNGERLIQTPSDIVEAQGIQAVTSGFRRIENSNDVDQMVGALYAGIGTQVLSSTGGLLNGLTSAIGSGASYLSRMTAESQAGLRNAAANAALQVLAAARAVEAQYYQAVNGILNRLNQGAGQLRSMENQCWNLIIYNTTAGHVCTAPPTGNTCTDAAGTTIHIATSTQFSQPIIDAQIAPSASQVQQNVTRSQQALTNIDQLIQGVTNTGSLDAQRLALVQLDQLVAQGRLHQQSDITAAQQQQSAVNDAMSQLVDQTRTAWADNADANVGWCNVNNAAVISRWDQAWR